MAQQSTTEPSAVAARHVVLFSIVTVLWGLNWPAMKVAVGGFDPWSFRALVLPAAAAVLFALARVNGQSIALPRRLWGAILLPSATVTGWHLLSAYGLTSIGGGRAAIIAFTMPIWAALLSSWILKEHSDRRQWVAMTLGMLGLGFLLIDDVQRLGTAPLGVFLMALAAMDWAIGTIAVRAVNWRMSTLALTGWQLLLGGVPIVIIWAVTVGPEGWIDVPTSAWLGWAYTTFIAMVICFASYVWLVTQLPATVVAIGLMAIPAVGVISSALVLGETVGAFDVLALFLVVGGQALVLRPRVTDPADNPSSTHRSPS